MTQELVGITLKCVFTKATTTVDGGWNITFSVGDDETKQVMHLSQMRNTLVQIGVVPILDGELDG